MEPGSADALVSAAHCGLSAYLKAGLWRIAPSTERNKHPVYLLSAIHGLTPGRDGNRPPMDSSARASLRVRGRSLPLPVTRNGNTLAVLVRALAFNPRNRCSAGTFSLLRVTDRRGRDPRAAAQPGTARRLLPFSSGTCTRSRDSFGLPP